jgi:hypothetical protein
MTDDRQQRATRINIEVPEDLDATYANFAVITHSPSEIIIDFSRVLPNSAKNKVQARIVMTPMNAKSLLQALSINLERFEDRFGEIKIPTDVGGNEGTPMGFIH